MKFSVLIPAYKKRYLFEAITSVINQSYSNFEIIVVNDNSPENLEEVISGFSDERIRYFKNEKNCGAEHVIENWNLCLGKAVGDFVICMGDDDILLPQCLEIYEEAIRNNPEYDAFHGRVWLINEQGNTIDLLTDRTEHESLFSNMYHRLQGRRQYIGDHCLRRTKLLEIGGYYYLPYAWGADDITSYLCAEPKGFVNINIPIFCYRVNNLSISKSGNLRQKMRAAELLKQWFWEFIKRQSAKDEVESMELRRLESAIPAGIDLIKQYIITDSLKNNRWSIFQWLRDYRTFNLNTKILLKSIYRGYIE